MQIVKQILRKKFGRNWFKVLSDNASLQYLISYTNLMPFKKRYAYILLGGHGLGLQAFMSYLDMMGAKPREIFAYDLIYPFVFHENFDGIVIEKTLNNSFVRQVLSTLKFRVPVYQIVRDPISVVKSCYNVELLHSFSTTQMQENREKILIHVIRDLSYLMFCFTSMQKSVQHITSDITYLTQDSIGQDNLQNTLNDFADRFGYKHIELSKEKSVLKGTAFPRAFPYIFEVNGNEFGLFIEGREKRHCEIDMLFDKRSIFKDRDYKIQKIKDLSVRGYENYPVYLAKLNHEKGEVVANLNDVELKAKEVLDYILEVLEEHQQLMLNEEQILEILFEEKFRHISKDIALKIHGELECLRKDRMDILKTFKYTERFLHFFNLDIERN
ncbi:MULTISPECIES: hypothetical protein [unclassified Helicobacter]|uniref:hypothetical protein n=1 Tax=unclassified Helicobacter TaxID=2593540 RepID=UPI000CF08124|nr:MULTISPECIES: hypothetical protein [unclassified Helicobacter]